MRIHKATGTNVTLCSRNIRGLVVVADWQHVDCVACLKSGGQYARQKPKPDKQLKLF